MLTVGPSSGCLRVYLCDTVCVYACDIWHVGVCTTMQAHASVSECVRAVLSSVPVSAILSACCVCVCCYSRDVMSGFCVVWVSYVLTPCLDIIIVYCSRDVRPWLVHAWTTFNL